MPPITSIDLSAITPIQLAVFALVVALIDFLGGVLAALVSRTFDPARIAEVLGRHILLRLFPIYGLAVLGLTVPVFFEAAIGGLVIYVLETAKSLQASLMLSSDPPPTKPAA